MKTQEEFDRNIKIVVLGGGISSEREVSLITSLNVCSTLRKLGYKTVFIDAYLGLEDFDGNINKLFDNNKNYYKNDNNRELNIDKIKRNYKNCKLGKNVLEICKNADCVFLGLHGEDGEDGKIQGTLELLGIPYTGSGPVGSAMAMDKSISRMVMEIIGIKCAPIVQTPPCVVKCIHGGSSLGTYICESDIELRKAISDLKKYNDEFIIEKKINGREFTVPILGEKALIPIEIIPPSNGKFDYIAKYSTGKIGAKEICPAPLDNRNIIKLKEMALKLHNALKLSVYSRTDFIMDENGNFYCLEINTLPGLTPNSLFPKAAKYEGYDYSKLCELIIKLSMEKYK